MRTTFFGYELARRSIAASQRSLDVTGHNIANANAPGYSRQRAILTATAPYTVPNVVRLAQAGQVGTGVVVTDIRRMQSSFLEAQARIINSDTGTWSRRQEAVSRLEALTNEPGESGLHALFNRFWESWHALSTDPASVSLRQGARQSAASLADGLNRMARQVTDLQGNADENLRSDVHAINSIAAQVSELNAAIRLARNVGDSPNDLMDQRDLALRELSEIANVTTREYGDGSIAVSIGGYDLVQQFGVNTLGIVNQPGNGYARVVWELTGVDLDVRAGSLAGSIEMRDVIYADFADELDLIADTVVAEVNALHNAGFDLGGAPGGDFFDPSVSGARGIKLSAAIAADANLIAASTDGLPGNGDNATAIAQIRDRALAGLGGHRLTDYYRGVISGLAVSGQEAERVLITQDLLGRQIDNQQAQESGVSLDEEMVELMKHQQVYTAAARLLSVMDEMIVTIIERMGAGR